MRAIILLSSDTRGKIFSLPLQNTADDVSAPERRLPTVLFIARLNGCCLALLLMPAWAMCPSELLWCCGCHQELTAASWYWVIK